MKKRKCTIHVAKTKALISFAVTAKLICVFVFAYADCWFSHEKAQMYSYCHNCNYLLLSAWFLFILAGIAQDIFLHLTACFAFFEVNIFVV